MARLAFSLLIVALLELCASGLHRPRVSRRVVMVAQGLRGGDDASDEDALFGDDDLDGDDPAASLNDLMGGLGGFPGMPGAGGFNGDMAQYEKMMETFMDSPLMQEFLNDPEKMEMSRQALLNNPMALQLMKSMPGLEEILYDKEKWQERMLASKAQFDAMRKARQESKAMEEDDDDDAPADDFED